MNWIYYKDFIFARTEKRWYWLIFPNGMKWQFEAKSDDEIKEFCDNYVKN